MITVNGVPLVLYGQVNRTAAGTIAATGRPQTFFALHTKDFSLATAAGPARSGRPSMEVVAAIRAGLQG